MSKDILNTVQLTVDVALSVARKAAQDFLATHGDRDACGFAWVTVYEKGSTKLGRALLKCGFRKEYGGGLTMWNPSGLSVQSLNVKEEGADAFAKFLREHLGVKAYAQSRMD
jgi:phage-related protein